MYMEHTSQDKYTTVHVLTHIESMQSVTQNVFQPRLVISVARWMTLTSVGMSCWVIVHAVICMHTLSN